MHVWHGDILCGYLCPVLDTYLLLTGHEADTVQLSLRILIYWGSYHKCTDTCNSILHYSGIFSVQLEITHGLVTPYGDRDLGQYWLSVDWSSVKSSDIHIMAISQEMPQPSITKICLNITYLKCHSNFPGANEIMHMVHCYEIFDTELKLLQLRWWP